ncbi:MAG TPA: V-type ATP synthase subunit D [Gemmatimonadales bacterium]|jgi:V/A-type H+-transporting ATPase subunit D
MTAGPRISPTRQNLLGLDRRLARVSRGTALLRRKREALVAELFRLARPAASARVSIADRAQTAYPLLLDALAEEGYAGLRALGWPGRELSVEIRQAQVWGIAVAELLQRPPIRRTLAARGTPPPTASPVTSETATAFEELSELLLDAANREALLRRLGEALNRTSRQVNTLERRLGPALLAQRAAIRRTLDEREREDHLRLERLVKRDSR